jgi:hypothetical protein
MATTRGHEGIAAGGMASSSNALSFQKAPQRKLRTIQIKKETAARAMKIEEEMGIKARQKLLCTRIRGRQDRNKFRVRGMVVCGRMESGERASC